MAFTAYPDSFNVHTLSLVKKMLFIKSLSAAPAESQQSPVESP